MPSRRPPPGPPPLQGALFDAPPPQAVLPPGMRYEPDFLSPADEAALIAWIAAQPLAEMVYKGYTARRRVVGYGGRYDYDTNRLGPAPPIPPELHPLRQRVADWLGIPPDSFLHALVAEYREGTPLGWHRDVPDFEDVVGISLGSDALMRFRPYPHLPGTGVRPLAITLAPRSIYLLHGPSRWDWQHSVVATPALRYSITFRTRRQRG
jgi:alkylated DNA repair dioxygenase AlkB